MHYGVGDLQPSPVFASVLSLTLSPRNSILSALAPWCPPSYCLHFIDFSGHLSYETRAQPIVIVLFQSSQKRDSVLACLVLMFTMTLCSFNFPNYFLRYFSCNYVILISTLSCLLCQQRPWPDNLFKVVIFIMKHGLWFIFISSKIAKYSVSGLWDFSNRKTILRWWIYIRRYLFIISTYFK